MCPSISAGLFHHIKRTGNNCFHFFSLSAHLCFSFVLNWVGLLSAASHLSALWLLSFFLSVFPPSFLTSFVPGVMEDFNFEQHTRGGKLCRNIWSCFFPPSQFREMSSSPKEQFQKAESIWLKPDNTHESLQLLQILVLLLWLFVMLLPLGPCRASVYLGSLLRSCQKMRAGLPFWPQVNLQLRKSFRLKLT